ncbi:MAG TPA: tRNA preQ1(34) S-adenosylmethionine ribosyltransferase-isomerase QueA [Kofleriaceae bacterium]|nr:tRNA preQ1(34) S-adenosylmethionine ribosyltransferase-isomerase QueA [Kofleriaceae bacterium]
MDHLTDYAFDLPPSQIAQAPADRRDQARLLVVDGEDLREARFADVPALLPPGALVILNDAKVIPARLWAQKPTGGQVELLAIEPANADSAASATDHTWRCMARSSKPLRAGTELLLTHRGTPAAEPRIAVQVVSGRDPAAGTVVIAFPEDPGAIMDRFGELALPPYIHRDGRQNDADRDRYQTVYARVPGAIAAPTAGLHFTGALLDEITARGHDLARLTLHVGPGTFAPIRTESIADHVMHEERFDIPEATATAIAAAHREGRPIVAVGTTCVRALESAATAPGQVSPGPGQTRLFIRPGYPFQIVSHLITNFHLPQSTLLMLVSAFSGHPRIMAAYRHAVATGFRFFSYGDAMLLTRAP